MSCQSLVPTLKSNWLLFCSYFKTLFIFWVKDFNESYLVSSPNTDIFFLFLDNVFDKE